MARLFSRPAFFAGLVCLAGAELALGSRGLRLRLRGFFRIVQLPAAVNGQTIDVKPEVATQATALPQG